MHLLSELLVLLQVNVHHINVLYSDRELEALRMARAHQESALQEMRTQLTAREEGEGEGEGEEDCAVLVDGGEAESILARLAELAPILSREAHAVNQLTKNMTL